MNNRELELSRWALEVLRASGEGITDSFSLSPASDDASFRRYFRGWGKSRSYIFMDAPPELEDSAPFVKVAGLLRGQGINVPEIIEADLGRGFIAMSDFGDALYLDALKRDQSGVDGLYQEATSALLKIQQIDSGDDIEPFSDELLQEEMDLFPDWFIQRQLGMEIDRREQEMLRSVFGLMLDNARQQPRVLVHRDYHSRNLMVLPRDNPGILDFQDAVTGPVTYDLVSLFRDCYIRWPAEKVHGWAGDYRRMLIDSGTMDEVSEADFLRWFDLMGIQRHIKVAGIFSRLNLRDGKPRYLGDIPLVISYLEEVSANYPELADFRGWLRHRLVPEMARRREFKE